MKFEDAVKKSIKAFMNGKIAAATNELSEEGIFHTPAYFDELEEEMLSEDNDEEIVDEDV